MSQRNKPPVIKHSENSVPNQDRWVSELTVERGDNNKLKLPHPTKGGASQAAAYERQKKQKTKQKILPNHLVRGE
jgi:hypothetical protein